MTPSRLKLGAFLRPNGLLPSLVDERSRIVLI